MAITSSKTNSRNARDIIKFLKEHPNEEYGTIKIEKEANILAHTIRRTLYYMKDNPRKYRHKGVVVEGGETGSPYGVKYIPDVDSEWLVKKIEELLARALIHSHSKFSKTYDGVEVETPKSQDSEKVTLKITWKKRATPLKENSLLDY